MVYENMNPNDVEPNTFASVVHNTELGRCLECTIVFGRRYQVQSRVDGRAKREVDLDLHECSCRMFEDLGIPCVHACCAALASGVSIPALCIEERRVGTLQLVYSEGISMVDIENVPSEPILPPLVKRLPGRPRTKRIRRAEEDRPTRITSCSFCGKRGHNIRTCPENYA